MNWYEQSKPKTPITDKGLLQMVNSLGFDENLKEKKIKTKETKEERKKKNDEWREQEYEHMPA